MSAIGIGQEVYTDVKAACAVADTITDQLTDTGTSASLPAMAGLLNASDKACGYVNNPASIPQALLQALSKAIADAKKVL